ncbi:hypothetical protein AB0N88_31490 [Streptomyces sp. NPDC093516]|uniref:hypothetical protein n=1 Tax=Streptomyces sp. NPDC093516 TaxID=3155304 RepID=UPI0034381C9B
MSIVQTFLTVVAILAMIAFGALLIRLLNTQHGDRATAFHYGRSGMPVPGPSAPRKAHGRAAASDTTGDRDRPDDGPRRPSRRHSTG